MLRTISAKLNAGAVGAVLAVAAMALVLLETQDEMLRRCGAVESAVDATRLATGVRAAISRVRRHGHDVILTARNVDLMDLRSDNWVRSLGDLHGMLATFREHAEAVAMQSSL